MGELMRLDDTGHELTAAGAMHQAGQAANRAAARHVFETYATTKAANTLRRQLADLALFAQYLADVAGLAVGDLAGDPMAWAGVTWGLVETFARWQLEQGYAVGTINIRLSTVRTYARLAMKAGAIAPTEYTLIAAVNGYAHHEALRIDEKRAAADQATRKGTKKADFRALTQEQAKRLKTEHANDGQGARDRLLMCLALDWGLRVGELAGLTVEDFDLDTLCPTLRLYRPKVDNWSTLDLSSTPATLAAARDYLGRDDAPTSGPIWRESRKDGRLTGQGLSERAITKRVGSLGRRILGIDDLSAHDMRHTAATIYGRYKTTRELMDIFGWSSPAMAVRYQEQARTVSI